MSLLPTEKTTPSLDFKAMLQFLYGGPKTGKSTFYSSGKKTLFLATEPGLNALSVYKVDIPNWKTIKDIGPELAKSKDFDFVVLDTVDIALDLCIEHVCKAENIRHMDDLDWGKGWGLLYQEFNPVIIKLARLPHTGFAMISHAKDTTIKSTSKEITKAVPTISGGARRFLMGLADIIFYLDVDGDGKRTLHTQPTENYEAGDRSGRLPPTLPLDWDAVQKAFTKGGSK